jgi:starch-binding outer membrane protein, SusD/RagB family
MTTMTSLFPKGARMFPRSALVLAATLFVGACNVLDTNPPDKLSDDKAIKTPEGARAALAGAYNELQDGFYYGGTLTHFGDLSGDNANETGTFTSYKDAAQHALFADNSDVTGLWSHIYDAIKRANILIARVPGVTGFQPGEQEQILGEGYFLRALNYHNLVKHFGGVPLRLEPITDPSNSGNITRATVAEVYAQIHSDLDSAELLMTNTSSPTNHATLGAAKALQARVYLFEGLYAQALAKAQEVVDLGYSLAPVYADLFNSDDADTPENIFKLTFTSALDQANLFGFYWLSDQLPVGAGRYELGPTQSLINAYDTLSSDVRLLWNIQPDLSGGGYIEGTQSGGSYGSKFPTPNGAEDFHIIRFAEVLLIKAEALARQGQLDSAVATYNLIRLRAALPPHVLGGAVTTQQDVLDAIDRERRLEFAEEGDRWTDMVRTGRAQTILGITADQELYPIPQAERDISPGVTQNPGY